MSVAQVSLLGLHEARVPRLSEILHRDIDDSVPRLAILKLSKRWTPQLRLPLYSYFYRQLFCSSQIFQRPANRDRFHDIFWRTSPSIILHCRNKSKTVLGITHDIPNLVKVASYTLLAKQRVNNWFIISLSAKHIGYPYIIMSPSL